MRNQNILLITFISLSMAANAQDRVFSRTYQSNVLPGGATEIEYWNTLRSGQEHFYNAIDQRIEFEVGLGKKVQTAFYLNMTTESYAPGDSFMVKENSFGFSNEWKWKLSDPVANKIGSALYFEAGFNGEEVELEGKLILDHQSGKNLFALNLVGEYEISWHPSAGVVETETETPFEIDMAYMRFIGKNAGLGLEVWNHNEVKESEWENSAWFAGPSFHIRGERWFVNLNVAPQLFNGLKEDGESLSRDLEDHQKVEARCLLSFSF
jgi:hypothetical protein